MATRMQQRRGTAAQWISTNSGNGPILAPGEIGFETDTNKFKIGDGVNHWVNLTYFTDAQSAIDALTDLVDGAPDLLNTLGEIAAALGDDPTFFTTVATNLSDHTSATTNVHGILDTDELATKEYVTQEIGNSEVDQSALAGSGLTWDAGNEQFAVDTTLIQERVSGVSDEEIGYLSGVTSDIQTQIDGKLASADLDEAAQEAVNTALVAGTGLDKTYDDLNNTITIDIDSTVATKTYADDAAATAQAAAELTASGALSTHSSDTTSVHGITDTAELATKAFAAELLTNATKTNIAITGDKNGLTITAENGVADSTTSDLTEGTNLYFTDERAQDAVGNAVGTGLSYNDSTGAISVTENTYDAYGSAAAITASTLGLGDVDNTSDADKPVSTATQTALDAKLALAGGTMTGAITLSADPSSALHAATKQYVDNTASGIVAKPQVLGATTANIDATYDNGTLGVGATLTHNTNGAFPAEAGGASGWAVGKGILVKNQTNKAENGRYFISDMGSPSTPYVLTRCGYCDEADEIPGAYIFVQDGTSAGTGWIQVVADPATFVVGTDNIDVYQFSGSGTITAGTNISVSGNEVSTVENPTFTSLTVGDVSNTEIGYLNGVTSGIQTQLDDKQAVVSGVSSTEIGYLDGVTSAIQTQLDTKAVYPTQTGNDGKFLKTDGTSASWDSVPVTSAATPTTLGTVYGKTDNNNTALGYYSLSSNTTGTNNTAVGYQSLSSNTTGNNNIALGLNAQASSPTVSNEITLGNAAITTFRVPGINLRHSGSTTTVSINLATIVDTTALANFTTMEYLVSIKQGSKIRSSKVLVQTDGTNVDSVEHSILETGGAIAGINVTAAVFSTNCILRVTITDAATTNATVKVMDTII